MLQTNHFQAINITLAGALAQLVARFNGIEEARSSNLLCSTIFSLSRRYTCLVWLYLASDVPKFKLFLLLSILYASTTTCLKLHNGAILYYWHDQCFYNAGSNYAVKVWLDPDGRVTTDGSINSPGKSLIIHLFTNGRINSLEGGIAGTFAGNFNCSGAAALTSQPERVADWFSW